ncbi:hypothetical protein ACIPJK_23815 [Streptomyces roseus]|uniref:hypothetical protein n=1 Tax=Streptomyces roseus TaxID=66430 RepID=UPI00382A7D51
MLRITTPVLGYTGMSAGVNFTNGVADIEHPGDDPQHPTARALAYFRAQGYGIEDLTEADTAPARARKTAQKGADQ